MVKLLFFRFRVINSRLKNKKLHFELLTRWLIFFHFRVRNVKLINEKNVRDPLEIDITLRFLRASYNSMSWGCPGMLKCSQILAFLAAFIDTLP